MEFDPDEILGLLDSGKVAVEGRVGTTGTVGGSQTSTYGKGARRCSHQTEPFQNITCVPAAAIHTLPTP